MNTSSSKTYGHVVKLGKWASPDYSDCIANDCPIIFTYYSYFMDNIKKNGILVSRILL